MTTTTELLLERIARIRDGIDRLLDRSSIYDTSSEAAPVVVIGPTRRWADLDVEGRRIQSQVLEEYRRLFEILIVLLRGLPQVALKELERADAAIREVLEQGQSTWTRSAEAARVKAHRALDKTAELLEGLFDQGGGVDVFVPDTNALLHHPHLEEWVFPSSTRFELILCPSVLTELDELKVNHRNPDVRAKAEGLITRIKGYRGRGVLTEGVPLRKPNTIRALAMEPRMTESLSWLDPGNRDDRFIASTLEIMRQHSRSSVVIVTRDINLQSKAELAGIPFVEPPDPA